MTDTPPDPTRQRPDPGSVRAPSVVIVNTGDGKGKSTAAFGTMLRALAHGWQVSVVQFLKSGEWKVGEEKMGRQLGVDWFAIGDGFTWDAEDITESEAVARAAWDFAKQVISEGDYQLVILDEVTYPINWGWIGLDEVIDTIRSRPDHVNLVLTGRDAPARLVDAADTVTEMKKVKHAYDRGIMARRGLDY